MRATVRLLEAEAETSPVEGAKWIQIAAEGVFKAREFTFDRAVFEQLIKNFRAHPAFELDEATGWGLADVIPYDFHHASEQAPAQLGTLGAPAQSWALDLDIRGKDGGLELWALTRYLEPARTYVQQGKYLYTSVAVYPNTIDPVTGENVGWYLTSIAFTNDPFIQGMEQIAAQRSASGAVLAGPERIFSELKYVLGMPETATAADVQLELSKLRAMASASEAPPAGVDVEGLLATVRSLLNLPLLSEAELVFAELDKLLGAVTAAPPAPIPAPEPAPVPADTALSRRKIAMWNLILKLARLVDFDLPSEADEVKQQVFAERVVEKILAEAKGADDVRAGLAALMKALEVEDVDAGVQRVIDLVQGGSALEKAMPALAALKEQTVKAQEEEEEEEVMAVMRIKGWGDELKDALLLQRRGGVALSTDMELDEFQANVEKRRLARDAFRKQHPVSQDTLAHLGTAMATSRADGGSVSPILAAMQPGAGGGAPTLGDAPGPGQRGGAPSVDLSRYEGANNVERAMAHIVSEAKEKGLQLSYDDTHSRACILVRELRASGALQVQS